MKITPLAKAPHPMSRVLHVMIPDRYDLAMTFCRMQEWYESPKYGRKHFSMEEFQRWYAKTYGNGVFTYPEDWSGFNVPSTAVLAIMNSDRTDMTCNYDVDWSVAEEALFDRLIDRGLVIDPDPTDRSHDWWQYRAPEPFYLIGSSKADPSVLSHEVAHGRFFVYPEYRKAVLATLRKYDYTPFARALLKEGYSKWTLKDEVHAYALDRWPKGFKPTPALQSLSRELKAIAA